MNDYIYKLCMEAKGAAYTVGRLSTAHKNRSLLKIASRLRLEQDTIKRENDKDLAAAKAAGLSTAMLDRLLLDESRIENMADSIEEIAELDDPIGSIENARVMPSGIRVGQMRVPIGVIAVIFESRPNVTTDIAALSLKSGNACILRGGKEALCSNTALHGVVIKALEETGLPAAAVSFVSKTDRDLVPVLLKQRNFIDIVIPRGGEELVKMVAENSLIPVLKHDKGLCHIFVDKSADAEKAERIAVNAKVQRPGVCNAVETLLIHADYPYKEKLLNGLIEQNVELRGCERTIPLLPAGKIKSASAEDWDTEYLDLILSVKTVDSMDEALAHIAAHGSGHSEAIVTEDYSASERFLREADSAAVFVNASTRFHDGKELGLGAEVGISTEKFHARGALGLKGLTSLKYAVYGHGEVRQA